MYTLYWKNGKREIVIGHNIADAMLRNKYSFSSIKLLDFYMNGNNNKYYWDNTTSLWVELD